MKAVQIKEYVPVNKVEVNTTLGKPLPKPGQLLIEVQAAGVNPIDWKICEGFVKQRFDLSFPIILGNDFSGIVQAVGTGVEGFKSGDEVYGKSLLLKESSGSFAEYINVDPNMIAQKPENLSHIEAASLPLVGVSAWQALVEYMHLKPGQKVLIHGGSGGIGSVAIQIAKTLGAYVATTVSTENIKYAQSLGADEVIDYKNQAFETVLKDYDAVYDTIGGDTYINSYKVLKKGGTIVSMLETPHEDLMKQYGVKAIFELTDVNKDRLQKLSELIDERSLNVQIDQTFPLDDTKKALLHLKNDHPRGKVVLKIGSNSEH